MEELPYFDEDHRLTNLNNNVNFKFFYYNLL